MRDFASSGNDSGDEPLPPVPAHWTDADGMQPEHAGEPLPPFVPGLPASASEDEFWRSLDEDSAADSAAPGPSDVSTDDEEADIPADAFFIPEGADHVPAGVDPTAAQPAEHREWRDIDTSAIADRLETVARRLRSEGAAALAPKLAGGDALDTLLAGLLAGYMAAHRH